MECFYCPELMSDTISIVLDENESKHAKALRIKSNEKVYLSNGKGLMTVARAIQNNKFEYSFNIDSWEYEKGELDFSLGLVLGILDNRDRMEFALEKAVELGAKDFYPLICHHSEKSKVNISRLKLKSISAMKQSIRAQLINIHQPITIDELILLSKDYGKVILGDYNGITPKKIEDLTSALIVIGPEGGLENKELENLKKLDNIVIWNMGNRRLRAETAAITAIGLLSCS